MKIGKEGSIRVRKRDDEGEVYREVGWDILCEGKVGSESRLSRNASNSAH